MPRCLGGNVFPPTGTIFELIQDIIGTNHLTKFHDDRTISVASKVLTRKNALPPVAHFHEDRTINVASRVKNGPPPGSYVVQANTNLLTKFHEDWTINVVSRVLTRKHAPPLRSNVFQANVTILQLIQDIIETNF
ncbi:hypothetical protein DPMN_025856 [Dreissena polymorpha]|uniref:Uncharacterized protein n=1 Tax=Dreissena polymorpha TaxID=45954 RepID=A0A9D4LRT4_DREPO|nr:hypothetical protein DPMN_025856 [Dreissena polymorpha]